MCILCLCFSDYFKRKEVERKVEVEEARARNELYECGCCFEDECLFTEMNVCADGHLFCRQCIARSAEAAFGEGKTHTHTTSNTTTTTHAHILLTHTYHTTLHTHTHTPAYKQAHKNSLLFTRMLSSTHRHTSTSFHMFLFSFALFSQKGSVPSTQLNIKTKILNYGDTELEEVSEPFC